MKTVHLHHILIPGALIVLVLFFLDMGHGPRDAVYHLYGFAHTLLFMLAAAGLARLPAVSRLSFLRQFAVIMLLVLVIGGTIELVQPLTGRYATWIDVGFNLLGGITGLVFFAPARRDLQRMVLIPMQLGVVFLAGLIFYGSITTLWDMHAASRQFPVLSDFESRFEAKRWTSGAIDTSLARTGKASLRVDLDTEKYAGTAMWRSLGDWQNYSTLALSIYNPGPKRIEITIAIRDEEHSRRGGDYHDRFNREFTLHQGWNDIRIPIAVIKNAPAERTMDLEKLTYLVVFTMNLAQNYTIYLDHIHLSP